MIKQNIKIALKYCLHVKIWIHLISGMLILGVFILGLSVFSAFQIRVCDWHSDEPSAPVWSSLSKEMSFGFWMIRYHLSMSLFLKHTAVISLTERPAVRCRNWSRFKRNVRNAFCSATIFTACLCRNVIFTTFALPSSSSLLYCTSF